jgi:PPE-repeat protein
MNFSMLPPEINSALINAGAGSEPMLAAAAAWEGIADELSGAAEAFNSVTSGLVNGVWQGSAAAAMAAAAAPYAGWLNSSAAQARQSATQAGVMAAEFETVQLAMVHPELVAANRSQLVSLVLSNIFGQNAPAIATAEALYEQMWALDVSAMSAYHAGASAIVSALTPFAQPLTALTGAVAGGVPTAAATPVAPETGFATILNMGNLGAGNLGALNVGFGNSGSSNIGGANLGLTNFGLGNLGSDNFGFGNIGIGNVGLGNSGNGNIGVGLTGNGQTGVGGLNSGTGNLGLFNSGNDNIGFFNSGNGNFGIGNSGNFNTGFWSS